eukprot:COSAG05_NODE_5677_length_1117_cov_36.014803_3_plen_124_part_01
MFLCKYSDLHTFLTTTKKRLSFTLCSAIVVERDRQICLCILWRRRYTDLGVHGKVDLESQEITGLIVERRHRKKRLTFAEKVADGPLSFCLFPLDPSLCVCVSSSLSLLLSVFPPVCVCVCVCV